MDLPYAAILLFVAALVAYDLGYRRGGAATGRRDYDRGYDHGRQHVAGTPKPRPRPFRETYAVYSLAEAMRDAEEQLTDD